MRWKHLNALLLVVGLMLLGGLVWRLDWQAVGAHLARVGIAIFALTVGLFALGLATTTSAWWLLIDPAASRARWRDLHIVFWGGYAINALTPGATLGEVFRATVLRDKIERTELIASLIGLNFLNTGIIQLFTLAGPLLGVFWPQMALRTLMVLLAVASLFLLPLALFYLVIRLGATQWSVRLITRLPVLRRINAQTWMAQAEQIDHRLRSFRSTRPQAFWRAVLLLVLARIVPILEVWVLLVALLPQQKLIYLGLLAGLVQTTNQLISWALTFIPAQVGVVEGGAALLFYQLGLDPVTGLALELIRRLRTLVCAAIGLALAGLIGLRQAPSTPDTVTTSGNSA